MDRTMSIGDLVSLLKQEIEERRALLAAIESRLETEPPATPRRVSGLAAAAVEILREVGRPMHGLDEILPALQARGFVVKHRAGLATTLLRTDQIVRFAPGTFALKSSSDARVG